MITVNEEKRIFHLRTPHASYVIGVNDLGVPEMQYFGAAVGDDDLTYLMRRTGRGGQADMPDAKTRNDDFCQTPLEISSHGQGDYRVPSLAVRYENGGRVTDLRYAGYELNVVKPDGGLPHCRDGETLCITLEDKAEKIKAHLYYALYDGIDAITRSVEIENSSDKIVFLDRAYSFNLDVENFGYDLVTLSGAWGAERNVTRQKLLQGVYTATSIRGASSHHQNPFMAICDGFATEKVGNVIGVNLIYSGSFELNCELDDNGNVRVNGGICSYDFSWKLDAGEKFVTPETAIAFSRDGIGGMSRAFHDLYRNHLIPKRFAFSPRPIVINNWEATYFDFDEQKLCSMIESVKGTGIDTFVLDDGWFGRRDDDTTSLGDWFVDKKKLPRGLKPLADCCRRNGMKFGLWFEPEMISRKSELFRAHPDWAIQVPRHEICEGRNQYVLDTTREDVRDYIKKTVVDLVRETGIGYIKWDFNRSVTEFYSLKLPADRQKEFAHRFCLGFYDILRFFEREIPDVIIEGCASGGGRFDAGALAYEPQIWTSDNSDAHSRTRIQYGTSLCYPLSGMDCHVSVCPNHQTGRVTPFKTRCDVAYFGATGYELDPRKLTEEEMRQVAERNAAYRRDENLIQKGDLYRLKSPFDGNSFAEIVVAKDKSRAVAIVEFGLCNEVGPFEDIIRLDGLDENAKYLIEETGETYFGSTLVNAGLSVPRTFGDFISFVYHFTRV